MSQHMAIVATVKARRITGGAIVTVSRGERVHRHRVSLRRYHRLLDTLSVHYHLFSGTFHRGGFECDLTDVAGLADARRWCARHGNRSRAQYWRAA